MDIKDSKINRAIMDIIHFKIHIENIKIYFIEDDATDKRYYKNEFDYLEKARIIKDNIDLLNDNFDPLLTKLITRKLEISNKNMTSENMDYVFTIIESLVFKEISILLSNS